VYSVGCVARCWAECGGVCWAGEGIAAKENRRVLSQKERRMGEVSIPMRLIEIAL
jgi:hypothetical protein